MGKEFPLSLLGPRRHDSQQSLDSIYEQKIPRLYAMSSTDSEISSEVGRSCTTLAAEQVHSSSIIKWWWMEIGAAILAILTMLVLITVLSVQDGKPLRTWDNGIITVNTIVAAISTVNRITLMFPVSGAISQAMWIWFARSRRSDGCKSKLDDLEIFDEASRGPWGSLLLLWRLKKTVYVQSKSPKNVPS